MPGIRGTGKRSRSTPGPKPPYEFLETEKKYTWLKAPRYNGLPMEVGPLARMLVAYASGHQQVKAAVNGVLKTLGVGPAALFSTLGRIAARAIETQLTATELLAWHEQLVANMKRGDLKIHNGGKWNPSTWPKEAQGWGFHEAPRGALGHWVRIKDGAIRNYQASCPPPGTRPAGREAASAGPTRRARSAPRRRPEPPGRDPSHAALVRPVHGVRGTRLRRRRQIVTKVLVQ